MFSQHNNSLPECLYRKSSFYRSFPKKQILVRIWRKVRIFSDVFFRTLKTHLASEFEVQIRHGELTTEAKDNLDILHEQFNILQYEDQIMTIFQNCRSFFPHILNNPYTSDLLCVVEDEVLIWLSTRIKSIQEDALRHRRQKNNLMCSKKSSAGPQIFNFTTTSVSEELSKLLETGLNFVPAVGTSSQELLEELEVEVLESCRKLYFSYYGYFPRQSPRISLSHSILTIISQVGTNTELIDKLVSLRDSFVENIPFFLSSIPKTSVGVKSLLKLVPEEVIISPSDKQVGISVLPFSWYEKEYRNQVVKGGHEQIQMTESHCIAVLQKRILNFRSQCSDVQLKILSEHWPRNKVVTHRIGVLKLVPKVKTIYSVNLNNSYNFKGT